jgi:hypothetical protein
MVLASRSKRLLASGIGGKLCGKNLDGDRAIEPRIPRPIHFAHPACAERGRDFIRAKLCAWSKRHNWP